MTFGQRLKQLMAEYNITQRQLSKELNIASSTLNGYANDYREPDFTTLISLSGYFDISIDYLLGNTEVPNSVSHFKDEKMENLLYYYEKLSPEMKSLLIEEAKLLLKYNNAASRQ